MAFSQGRSSIEELQELGAELGSQNDSEDSVYEGLDLGLEYLLDSAVRIPGLRWRLDFLNKSLGSLRTGDFGFLMKRPETGGTTFLASEVSYMLDQIEDDEYILWLNNEEVDEKVAIRLYQAYFGVTLQELSANSTRYRDAWRQRVGNKLQFFGIDYSNKSKLKLIVEKYKPRLLVIDQIDKVQGFEADRDDLRLGAIYEWHRNLIRPYGACIGVTQANGAAEGVKYLNMSHTANSQTSKAAEADFIIGIGKSHNTEEESNRYFSICKNKLIGDSDTLSQFRHGHMGVLIRPDIMRYEDVISYD